MASRFGRFPERLVMLVATLSVGLGSCVGAEPLEQVLVGWVEWQIPEVGRPVPVVSHPVDLDLVTAV